MQNRTSEDLPLDVEILRAYGGLIVFFACFWGLLKTREHIEIKNYQANCLKIEDNLMI